MAKLLPELTRQRRDGWTPAVQQCFLDELVVTGSPAQAAAAAGRSLQSAYKLRARVNGTAFRDGWAAAIATCILQVRDTAVDRALNGHVEPILRLGRKVGERRISNNGMLLSLMRLYDAPAYHADRARAELAATAEAPTRLTDAELREQLAAVLAELARLEDAEADEIVKDTLLQRVAFDSPSKGAGVISVNG